MKTQTQVILTHGAQFTNIQEVGTRAVRFVVHGQGECVVGFAKDKNAFMKAQAGVVQEVTRWAVLKELEVYKGKDVVQLVSVIKGLVPAAFQTATCETCGCGISGTVKDYSTRVFGKALCRTHQKGAERMPTPERRPQGGATAELVTCDRCGGRGLITLYDHVDGGTCFKCKGVGKVDARRVVIKLKTDTTPTDSDDNHTHEREDTCASHDAFNCSLCAAPSDEEGLGNCKACGTLVDAEDEYCGNCFLDMLNRARNGDDTVFAPMDESMEVSPEWEAEAQAACNESITIKEDKPKRKASTPRTPKATPAKESATTTPDTKTVSDKETDEPVKAKAQTQRGSRKTRTGIKGASAKGAEPKA